MIFWSVSARAHSLHLARRVLVSLRGPYGDHLVFDARNWLPGKHVLLAPQWIERSELG
jgi:hypothetical protein